jgi:hypothetical protein
MSDKREFIAWKRTDDSHWNYIEYSSMNENAVNETAPDGGNFCQIRLVEKSAYDSLLKRSEKLVEALDWYWAHWGSNSSTIREQGYKVSEAALTEWRKES